MHSGSWTLDHRRSRCFYGNWANVTRQGTLPHYIAYNQVVAEWLDHQEILHWGHGAHKYEFRQYHHVAQQVKITYLGWFGDHPVLVPIRWDEPRVTPYFFCVDHRTECWNFTFLEAMRTFVPSLCPTDLIVNGGLWNKIGQDDTKPLPESFFTELAQLGRSAVAATGGRVFWRTSTAVNVQALKKRGRRIGFHDLDDVEPCVVLQRSGWGIINAGVMTRYRRLIKQLQVDDVHFRCTVYNAINSFILDVLCQ